MKPRYEYTINGKYENNVSLVNFVKNLPANFENDGVLLFKARNVIKKFAISDDMEIVVKKYKIPIFIQRVVYSYFRKTKAERAYVNAAELMRRGIDTPMNIAWAAEFENNLFKVGYFVSDVNDASSIEEELCYGDNFNRALAEEFAQFVAKLHSAGVIHKDLNCTNVLYKRLSESNYEFSLIDNNRMKFYAEGKEPSQKVCMENLTLFTGDLEVLRHVAGYYAASRCWDREKMVDKIMKVKINHDKKWKRKKRLVRLLTFKGLTNK